MIQLSTIKTKLSWTWIFIIALYLGSILVLVAVFWPTTRELKNLQSQIRQLEQNEDNFTRVIQQRPELEKKQRELGQRLSILAKDVPSQYDLPEVLEYISNLALVYGLQVDNLSHVPLKASQEEKSGVIPLEIRLTGGNNVLVYMEDLQTKLPSLQISHVVLSYGGNKQFVSEIAADLHVLIQKQDTNSSWEMPAVYAKDSALELRGFGLPFETVSKFLGKEVQVLGIVQGNGQSSALMAQGGTKRWLKVGERFGEATVSSIQPGAVTLNVDGVLLKLTIGG